MVPWARPRLFFVIDCYDSFGSGLLGRALTNQHPTDAVTNPITASELSRSLRSSQASTAAVPGTRRKFGIVGGGVYTTNRRFQKMGRWRVIKLFLTTALNYRNQSHFLRDHKYWQA